MLCWEYEKEDTERTGWWNAKGLKDGWSGNLEKRVRKRKRSCALNLEG